MTQQEHLQLIRAKCVELLELAKQRTPGRWAQGRDTSDTHLIYGLAGRLAEAKQGERNINEHNAAFIASAAGPFEAALASTVAAIDMIAGLQKVSYGWDGDCGAAAYADNLTDSIITSWPLELLQP